jgi:hypothetical protein
MARQLPVVVRIITPHMAGLVTRADHISLGFRLAFGNLSRIRSGISIRREPLLLLFARIGLKARKSQERRAAMEVKTGVKAGGSQPGPPPHNS